MGDKRMKIKDFSVFAAEGSAAEAALLFAEEIGLRTDSFPFFTDSKEEASFIFETDSRENKDSFTISIKSGRISFIANGIRGLIFAFAKFLKKCRFTGEAELVEDISGTYNPYRKIRGHQLGYRTTPNTYDAWDLDDYFRYYLDIMFMGCNMVEHIPYENGSSDRNRLMKYDEEEFLVDACEMADRLDLDVSLWYPNRKGETDESASKIRRELLEKLPRVNVIFPPGGDPGEMPADDFVKRCQAIKNSAREVFENIEMWPSAQAPHSIENWGDTLIDTLNKDRSGIDGIIMGPNHAFPIDELRRKVPADLPLRFYPDITHNVRCEYPVHHDRDDWHFALASGLSRECTNPRPVEYAQLHKMTSRYVCGSVSYSEGITDDVNKFIWSALDFDPDTTVREALLDYARLFFPGVPEDLIADAVLALEINWVCAPENNPAIDSAYTLYTNILSEYPFLNGNWRFNQLLFRAECDMLIRTRRIFENSLIRKAKKLIENNNPDMAKAVLETEFPADYKEIRSDIDRLAELLFEQIGLQLDVEHYCANSWERGAVLETIDLPVTDRAWLLNRFEYSADFPFEEKAEFMKRIINRNRIEPDEFYYSVAFDGLAGTGMQQQGEVYLDFQGDRPNVNNGSLPTCLFNIFDNFSFRLKTGGFIPGRDYRLKVTFKNDPDDSIRHMQIIANGNMIYDGPRYGGTADPDFDKEMMPSKFITAEYLLPASVFENGCLELVMKEATQGVMFAELRIIRN